jgi:hypothetical protein
MELKQTGYGMCVPLIRSLLLKCDHYARQRTYAHTQLYKTGDFIKRFLLQTDKM